jgi:hypothetical protein
VVGLVSGTEFGRGEILRGASPARPTTFGDVLFACPIEDDFGFAGVGITALALRGESSARVSRVALANLRVDCELDFVSALFSVGLAPIFSSSELAMGNDDLTSFSTVVEAVTRRKRDWLAIQQRQTVTAAALEITIIRERNCEPTPSRLGADAADQGVTPVSSDESSNR